MNKQKEGYVFDPFELDRRLEYAERRLRNSDICEENKRLILDYKNYVQFRKKLSKDRIEKWINTFLWSEPLLVYHKLRNSILKN